MWRRQLDRLNQIRRRRRRRRRSGRRKRRREEKGKTPIRSSQTDKQERRRRRRSGRRKRRREEKRGRRQLDRLKQIRRQMCDFF